MKENAKGVIASKQTFSKKKRRKRKKAGRPASIISENKNQLLMMRSLIRAALPNTLRK